MLQQSFNNWLMILLVELCSRLVLTVSTMILVVMKIVMMVMMMNLITRMNMNVIKDNHDDDDDIRQRVNSKEWSALLLKLPSPSPLAPFSCVIMTLLITFAIIVIILVINIIITRN